MENESLLLASAWTFVLALAVGASVNRLLWARWDWPRAGLIAVGLAMARAVIVAFDAPFLLKLPVLVVLLGASVALANRFFPRTPAVEGEGPS